ncbi:MAG: c-type cytochrome [Spongiibacteraceae bacterium]|nr:c-type cytochrome [Spongiibacteraceae bacterium]
MSKLFPAALAVLVSLPVLADDAAVAARYAKTCAICHTNGVANAPRTGDADAWQERMTKGMDALLASVRNGLSSMPPKGMCFDCTDADFAALIDYMAKAK